MKDEKKCIIYHAETTSIVPRISSYNILYSWQKPLEEPTHKEIFPCVIYSLLTQSEQREEMKEQKGKEQ